MFHRALPLLLLLTLSAGLSNCAAPPSLQYRYDNHIVLNANFWQPLASRTITERFDAANAEVLDYVTLDNILYDYPERPQPSTLTDSFKHDVNTALASIPANVLALVDRALFGIVFLDDLGSTGFTAYVLNEQRQPQGAFIVMDTGALQRNANAWASWKESTPFAANADIRIESTIEHAENNTRANAIRYILLHEFAHVLAAVRPIHPRFDQPWQCDQQPLSNYSYLQFSWVADPSSCRVSAIFDAQQMPQREQIHYYSAGNLPATHAAVLYRQLRQTNFPTLYAATNWYDDFADGFVNYIHTVLDHRPFSINIYEHEQLIERYESCWNEPRCAAKRAYFDALLGHTNQ